MRLLELLTLLVLACIALGWAARRVGLPYPVALVGGGVALGLLPGLPRLEIDPDLLLAVVLPPILYQAALLTSWRDFKANARAIGLLAFGLVIATTVAVAAVARWLIPELSWPLAFALGAIVSAPDAVAATAVLARVHLPRRIVAILEGESLVNDATCLVLFAFAVEAAVSGRFSLGEAAVDLVWVAAGGIAVGVALGRVFVAVHRHLHDPLIEIMVSLVLPFAAYLAAAALHCSGVLAVVAAGLVRGRWAPEVFSPQMRILAHSMWNAVVFLLNCLVFILIGMQLAELAPELSLGQSPASVLWAIVLVTAVAMLVRLVWVFPGAYLPRLAARALGRDEQMPPWRHVLLVGWCGMRGVVTLAAALALPLAAADGTPLAGRELVILIALGVMVLTLVVPALTLLPLVRRLGIGGDWGALDEERRARSAAARAGLAEVERLIASGDIDAPTAELLRALYRAQAARSEAAGLLLAPGADTLQRARLAGLRAERAALLGLWREGRIGDEVLHRVERELDYAEARLSG